MTRAKYNKNPKLTREQWILFFKQQTIQVAMLIEALDQAYDKIRRLEAQKNKREEEDADEDSVDKLKIIEKEEEVLMAGGARGWRRWVDFIAFCLFFLILTD